ncbi:DUF177 domain-containing protein [Sphingomonas sp. HDW15A]|uniref:DUF177 domain-containing protein n=1 Tax=Sphingomonas sp. HDW15A TaxID=2714942 RepID=UPI00140CA3FE|nr:DUF177 domain-containing protein [Sphingomonas sp. HDW15A]QIK97011.1 DUF177 domain-containing protein [Sphingomonas sp. HDW15A]
MSERFSLALPIAAIRGGDRIDLVAEPEECASIANRLNLPVIGALQAHAMLERDGDRVKAIGRLKASLEQSCVATGEPLRTRVDEPFELHFMPEPKVRPDEELELRANDLDTVFHDGAVIPLGEALVDTLALALDPFPRGPNAAVALHEAGVISEEEAGPFAALAALKRDKGDGA